MDSTLFQFFQSLTGKSELLDSSIFFLAKYLTYLIVALFIFFTLKQDLWKKKVLVFITGALAVILSRGIITELIRFVYDRPRPFEALDFEPLFLDLHPSFPSGHAAFLFALGAAVFYFNKKWGWWFLGLALINGLARMAAGVHFPSDILGGILVALFSFWAIWQFMKPYIQELSKLKTST